jgi:peptide-methionine (R)-S-oxide reductase
MTRRGLIGLVLGALAARLAGHAQAADRPSPSQKAIEDMQKNWKALLAKDATIAADATPIQRTREEWKKLLTPQQFNVLREEGTEYAGTSPLNFEKRAGVFVCAGCALPLFTSDMKYDSGTGWPSFFTAIPGAFGNSTDYKLIYPRTEYHCAKCGGHHGHVFDDGPPPTRQRWCNNGVALRFIPATAKS